MPFRRSLSIRHDTAEGSRWRLDYRLLAVAAALVLIGLFTVYDASAIQAFRDYNDKYFYIRQQLLWVILGSLSVAFFAFLPYRILRTLAPILFGVSVILLLAVFIPGLGYSAGGAHRWLRLGIFSVQPAEIIKLTSIIFFASLFQKKDRIAPFAMITLMLVVIIGLFQRDLGSAIVFFLSVSVLFFLSGVQTKYILYGLMAAIAGFIMFVATSGYRQRRVMAFLDPFSDPQGYTYHISQVLIALGSGGWFGLGLGQSRQKFEFIPEVTTDSIFAIIGEEFGFFGALILIGLLGYLVWRGLQIASECHDPFGRMLAFGLTSWLGIQSLVNLGSMVSLIPLTGVPLPFISYGGSALLANLIAVGILLSIARENAKHRA